MAADTLSDTLDALLKLPASDRAELAMALWDSLTDAEHDAEFTLSDELRVELDRRWEQYLANPEAAVPLDVAKERLRHRR
jgi:putative addiction module component (TIGR02574 family)